MGVTCSKYGSKEWCYRNLVRNSELKGPHGRSRHWYEDNIKLDVHGSVGCLDRIYMGLSRRGCPPRDNVVMNLRVR